MKSIVPYTKDIVFETKIAEICSISLEHELTIGETEIEGQFIITGEYKTHEVSVNKEPFSYKLPFTLEVTENIVKDSINFEITDFTYEIKNEDTLQVHIEFCVSAEEVEEELKEEETEQEELRESVLEEINELFPEVNEEVEEEVIEPEERLDENSENIILDAMQDKESEFATYHIHVVDSNDSIESICATYNTNEDILKDYNKIDKIEVGDKIIIPCIDE